MHLRWAYHFMHSCYIRAVPFSYQKLDDSTGSLVNGAAFLHGVVGEAESDVKAALAVFALNDGFKLVIIRRSYQGCISRTKFAD